MELTAYIAITAALVSAAGALTAWIANKRARAINASGQIGSLLIELNRIFVDQPDLRPYFIEGGKLPKGQEQKAKALASMYLNVLEMVWSMEDVMAKHERTAWIHYIQYQIRSVPIVDNLYELQKEWYPNLNRTVDKI